MVNEFQLPAFPGKSNPSGSKVKSSNETENKRQTNKHTN